MSNYTVNQQECKVLIDLIKDIDKDLKDIPEKVLTKSVNESITFAKMNTPVVTGWLRKNWYKTPTVKYSGGASTEIGNNADYALYWNNGHRIVRNGVTVGFVTGSHFIEDKIIPYLNKRLNANFKNMTGA